jgi:CubicO group peptidase (beta-lactamase class C family)
MITREGSGWSIRTTREPQHVTGHDVHQAAPTEARPLADDVARRLHRSVAERQRDWRSAAVAAAVVRDGAEVWSHHVGSADVASGLAPGPDVQFRMGSITKTFTATLVMQCRDDGLLDLDDRLETHLPGTRHGGLTIRRMLAHASGLQREPVGEVWARPEGPARDELLAGVDDAEAVLDPGRRWHYSNLAYALLGEVVARLRGQSWEQALRARVLDPLGLRRTTPRRAAPYATGYLTDPYADRLHEEPEFPGNAFAPAAELWTTTTDLGRWAAFLADPDRVEGVLGADTVEEMCHPQVIADLDAWTVGWGLGLQLFRRGERVLAGHGGAMPGFLAGLVVRRPEKVGAVVLANTSAGADPVGLALDLAVDVLDGDPAGAEPWRPGPPVPAHLEELLGVWWTEGNQVVFSCRDGRLEARLAGSPRRKEPAVFVEEGPDRFRVRSGREHGELLRVVRRADGSVDRMLWATYPVTRDCLTFGS